MAHQHEPSDVFDRLKQHFYECQPVRDRGKLLQRLLQIRQQLARTTPQQLAQSQLAQSHLCGKSTNAHTARPCTSLAMDQLQHQQQGLMQQEQPLQRLEQQQQAEGLAVAPQIEAHAAVAHIEPQPLQHLCNKPAMPVQQSCSAEPGPDQQHQSHMQQPADFLVPPVSYCTPAGVGSTTLLTVAGLAAHTVQHASQQQEGASVQQQGWHVQLPLQSNHCLQQQHSNPGMLRLARLPQFAHCIQHGAEGGVSARVAAEGICLQQLRQEGGPLRDHQEQQSLFNAPAAAQQHHQQLAAAGIECIALDQHNQLSMQLLVPQQGMLQVQQQQQQQQWQQVAGATHQPAHVQEVEINNHEAQQQQQQCSIATQQLLPAAHQMAAAVATSSAVRDTAELRSVVQRLHQWACQGAPPSEQGKELLTLLKSVHGSSIVALSESSSRSRQLTTGRYNLPAAAAASHTDHLVDGALAAAELSVAAWQHCPDQAILQQPLLLCQEQLQQFSNARQRLASSSSGQSSTTAGYATGAASACDATARALRQGLPVAGVAAAADLGPADSGGASQQAQEPVCDQAKLRVAGYDQAKVQLQPQPTCQPAQPAEEQKQHQQQEAAQCMEELRPSRKQLQLMEGQRLSETSALQLQAVVEHMQGSQQQQQQQHRPVTVHIEHTPIAVAAAEVGADTRNIAGLQLQPVQGERHQQDQQQVHQHPAQQQLVQSRQLAAQETHRKQNRSAPPGTWQEQPGLLKDGEAQQQGDEPQQQLQQQEQKEQPQQQQEEEPRQQLQQQEDKVEAENDSPVQQPQHLQPPVGRGGDGRAPADIALEGCIAAQAAAVHESNTDTGVSQGATTFCKSSPAKSADAGALPVVRAASIEVVQSHHIAQCSIPHWRCASASAAHARNSSAEVQRQQQQGDARLCTAGVKQQQQQRPCQSQRQQETRGSEQPVSTVVQAVQLPAAAVKQQQQAQQELRLQRHQQNQQQEQQLLRKQQHHPQQQEHGQRGSHHRPKRRRMSLQSAEAAACASGNEKSQQQQQVQQQQLQQHAVEQKGVRRSHRGPKLRTQAAAATGEEAASMRCLQQQQEEDKAQAGAVEVHMDTVSNLRALEQEQQQQPQGLRRSQRERKPRRLSVEEPETSCCESEARQVQAQSRLQLRPQPEVHALQQQQQIGKQQLQRRARSRLGWPALTEGVPQQQQEVQQQHLKACMLARQLALPSQPRSLRSRPKQTPGRHRRMQPVVTEDSDDEPQQGSQGMQYKTQQQLQRRRQRQPALGSTSSSHTSHHTSTSSSGDFTAWLPQLLQYQGFCTACRSCGAGAPVKYFALQNPGQAFCAKCCPGDARVVHGAASTDDTPGSGAAGAAAATAAAAQSKQQQQPPLEQQQQQQQCGPLLLSLHHSGKPQSLGAVSPQDMTAMHVDALDIKLVKRNLGKHDDTKAFKLLLLLHPSATGRTADGECKSCLTLRASHSSSQSKEQHQQQPVYCCLACKLQQCGLEAFQLKGGSQQQQLQQQECLRKSKREPKPNRLYLDWCEPAGSGSSSIRPQQQQQQQQQLKWSDIPYKPVKNNNCQIKRKTGTGSEHCAAAAAAAVPCASDIQAAKRRCAPPFAAAAAAAATNAPSVFEGCLPLQQPEGPIGQKPVLRFPALKLSGEQASWKKAAWKHMQQQGLAKLATLPPLGGFSGGSDSSSNNSMHKRQRGKPSRHAAAAVTCDAATAVTCDAQLVQPAEQLVLQQQQQGPQDHEVCEHPQQQCTLGVEHHDGSSVEPQSTAAAAAAAAAGLRGAPRAEAIEPEVASVVKAAVMAATVSASPKPPAAEEAPVAVQPKASTAAAAAGRLAVVQAATGPLDAVAISEMFASSSTAATPAAAAISSAPASVQPDVQGIATAVETPAVTSTAAAARKEHHTPATIALLLLHAPGWVNASAWEAWAAAHASPADVGLHCHVKAGVNLQSRKLAGADLVQKHALTTRVNAVWGDTSLVQAFLDSLSEILQRYVQTSTHQQQPQAPAAATACINNASSMRAGTAEVTAGLAATLEIAAAAAAAQENGVSTVVVSAADVPPAAGAVSTMPTAASEAGAATNGMGSGILALATAGDASTVAAEVCAVVTAPAAGAAAAHEGTSGSARDALQVCMEKMTASEAVAGAFPAAAAAAADPDAGARPKPARSSSSSRRVLPADAMIGVPAAEKLTTAAASGSTSASGVAAAAADKEPAAVSSPKLRAHTVVAAAESSPKPDGLRHIMLASGHDIPLRLIPAGFLPRGVTLYGSYDYPAEHLAELQVHMYKGMCAAGFGEDEARQWTSSLVPHHQWMVISVEHALVLMGLRDKILQVATAVNAAWIQEDCPIAPDEYIILTALRWAGCIRELKPVKWLTPKRLQPLQPGAMANCCPTQVMYPAPAGWSAQVEQLLMPSTHAADAGVVADGSGSRQGAAGVGCGAWSLYQELLEASCAQDKHPVTWRDLDSPVWCEEEEDGCMFAAKFSLRKLLAAGASRCALVLRKVDVRPADRDYAACKAAEARLLEVLHKMWRGQPPKFRPAKRWLILDRTVQHEQQPDKANQREVLAQTEALLQGGAASRGGSIVKRVRR